MTKAICFNCGGIKHGAFTSCKACLLRPGGEGQLVQSLGLTDHYLTQEQLETVSLRIQKGEAIQFEPEQMELLRQEIKVFLMTPVGKMLSGQGIELPRTKWWQFWKA